MADVFKIPANIYLEEVKEELKKLEQIKPPVWADFVKTGMAKERPPVKDDWWYMRAASILRTVAIKGPIGVAKLRTKYGSKKNRGVKPERFYKGSGNILRKALQQLEAAGLIEQKDVKGHKGRVLTKKGQSLLDKTTIKLSK